MLTRFGTPRTAISTGVVTRLSSSSGASPGARIDTSTWTGATQETPGLIPVPHNRAGGNRPAGVGGLGSRTLDNNAGTDGKSGAQTPASRSDLGDRDRRLRRMVNSASDADDPSLNPIGRDR